VAINNNKEVLATLARNTIKDGFIAVQKAIVFLDYSKEGETAREVLSKQRLQEAHAQGVLSQAVVLV
jgi:hypothetical protein